MTIQKFIVISMLSILLLSLVYLTAATPAILNERTFRIYNGDHLTDWSKVEYNFIVMLLSEALSTCTGSFVSSKKILTAGHCVCNPHSRSNVAVLEHVNTIAFEKWDKRKIIKYNIAPSYATCGDVSGVDMAIVTLENEVDLKSNKVALANISFDGDPKYGDEIVIIGYGKAKLDNDYMELRIGKSLVVDCQNMAVPHKPICLQSSYMYNWQHTRAGDSGGPLIWKRMGEAKVYGVLSGGLEKTEEMSETYFASTTLNKEFIQKYL